MREFLELLAHAEASGHGSESQSGTGTGPSPAADSTSNRNVDAADLALRRRNAKEKFTADLRDVLLFPEMYVEIIEDVFKATFLTMPADSSGTLFETWDGLWALVLVGDTREWQLVKIEDKGEGEGEGPTKFAVGTELKFGGIESH